jgi:hypothetical protein
MEPLTQTAWRWGGPLCGLLSWVAILCGGCVFRSLPATDFNARRLLILFRRNPATDSDSNPAMFLRSLGFDHEREG